MVLDVYSIDSGGTVALVVSGGVIVGANAGAAGNFAGCSATVGYVKFGKDFLPITI